MPLARFFLSQTPAIAAVLALASAASAQVAISYNFSQSVGSYVPITGGTVLGTVTGTSGAASLDDVTYPVTLPFTFNFDNIPQTQLYVNTNGFVSFGSTAPAGATYTCISSTTAYAGAVAAANRDLQGGFVFAGTRTLGSDMITAVSSLGPIQVGDLLVGTGIPTGATVLAIIGSDIQMSATATASSAGTAVSAFGPWSEIRYETLGSSPNRTFVVQWSNFKPFGATLTTSQHFNQNFQVRLDEATGEISVSYGNCSPGLSTSTTVAQVGLRGPNNTFATNVNNRRNVKGTNDNWLNSIVGTANSSGMLFNNTAPANVIPNGLEYKWTPALIATNVNYGTGCYSQFDSFYQLFASRTASAPALSNTSFSMAFTGTGYVVTSGGVTYVPPGGGATSFTLGDDADVDTPALTTPFPYIGGATSALRVCSNGFVSVAAGNGTGFSPTAAAMLSAPQTGWWVWSDMNPSATGSGQVWFEEVGSMVYVTYDGVYNYTGTSAADANTFQFQFDCSNGNVGVVFGTMSATGGSAVLVGYSTGGPNLDPGSMNLATGLPIVTGPDLAALALAAAPRPVLGTTYTYTLSNIPLPTVVSALVLSIGQANVSLAGMGAPGCFQYVDLGLSSTNLLFLAPTDTYSVALPLNLSMIGLIFYGQGASLVPGVNPLNVITSNGVASTLSNI